MAISHNCSNPKCNRNSIKEVLWKKNTRIMNFMKIWKKKGFQEEVFGYPLKAG